LNPVSFPFSTCSTLSKRVSPLIGLSSKPPKPTRELSVIPKKDDAIVEASSDDEEDDDTLSPSKPSHIEFRKSTIKVEDLVLMKKLGYFGKMTMN
jgi:hypothetical protein